MSYLFVARTHARSLCVHPNFQATTRATSDNFVACRSRCRSLCVHTLKAASHDSQMLVTATYRQQMTEVISSTSLFDQLNSRRRMLHFADEKTKTVSSSFAGHCILATTSKNNFFVLINNLSFFRQIFRTILH